jgi:hypothetical protein
MSKNTKIILIILGVVGALTILCCGGFMALGYFSAQDSMKAVEEGQQFGHSATQQDCQEATWKRADACGPTDIGCPIATENFFKGCLMNATETPGFCEGLPEVKGVWEAGIEGAEFAQVTCEQLGSTRFRPRDPALRPSQQACVQVLQARVFDCNAENLAKAMQE